MFSKTRLIWAAFFLLLFITGMIGGYIYFLGRERGPVQEGELKGRDVIIETDFSYIKMSFPVRERLITEERKIRRQPSTPAMAGAIVEEFIKGPLNSQDSLIPAGVKVLDTYIGKDGILYIDFSDELRRNFQGDAYGELLLLRGLYESIMSNLSGIEDVKVIVEGKEIESLGGHINIIYPLKNTLTVLPGGES